MFEWEWGWIGGVLSRQTPSGLRKQKRTKPTRAKLVDILVVAPDDVIVIVSNNRVLNSINVKL